ncbi:M23 family metallopeptidase [Nocardioides sp. BYT-33-1]|uniref:M23 family metallopeptidase n=1 Tax=Nocardioides sp. BYT-33-1 TaxID=3416952 RepID=UPI003F529807
MPRRHRRHHHRRLAVTTARRSGILALLVPALVLPVLFAAAPAARADPVDPIGVWPLHPVPSVVQPFDPPDTPYAAGHRGVDLAGRVGQPVRTALDGTVVFAGRIAGRGVVVVGHGATRTTYEPVTASVGVGDRLRAGAVIGTLELAGSHCFPRACLHWGWLAGETYLDPLRLVGGGPVRLLPLWQDVPAAGPVIRPVLATMATLLGMSR